MKSKFAVLVVILAIATVFTILYSPRKPRKVEIEVSVPKPQVFLKEAETPYEYGFQKGYCALLMQYGENVARPKVAIYTSSEHENESEEMVRGYIDGYHRACDSFICPRKN